MKRHNRLCPVAVPPNNTIQDLCKFPCACEFSANNLNYSCILVNKTFQNITNTRKYIGFKVIECVSYKL